MEIENVVIQNPVQKLTLDDFSYKSLNLYFLNPANDRYICKNGYTVSSPLGGTHLKHFITIGRDAIEEQTVDKNDVIFTGKLKFHISLPEDEKKFSWYNSQTNQIIPRDSNNNNSIDTYEESLYEKAWQIVCDVLIEYQVKLFKIVKVGVNISSEKGEEGKDITIFAYHNKSKTRECWNSTRS